jgi:hypothetical protein
MQIFYLISNPEPNFPSTNFSSTYFQEDVSNLFNLFIFIIVCFPMHIYRRIPYGDRVAELSRTFQNGRSAQEKSISNGEKKVSKMVRNAQTFAV